jgi:ribose transport system substrate-binding protein
MKKFLALVLSLLMVAPLAVFGQTKTAGGTPRWTVGVLMCTWSNPFAQAIYDGVAQRIAAYPDVKFIMLDGKDDPIVQTDQIDSLIQQKVDLIILQPSISDSLIPAVEKINKAGIPLVLLDRKMWKRNTNIHWECLVNWDMVLAGEINAKQVAEAVKGKGKIIVVEGQLGTSTMEERGGAFYKAIANYPNIKIIYTVQGDFARSKGMEVTQDILARFRPGDFDAIYYMNDEMCLGGLQAIKAARRLGEFKIISCDGSSECMQALRSGEIDYECAVLPGIQGCVIDVAVDILKGKFSIKNTYTFGKDVMPWAEELWEGYPNLKPICYWVDKKNMNDPMFVGY